MRSVASLLVVVALLVVGVGPALGSPSADEASCSYDEAELREYQPETAVDHLAVKPAASYGGIYSSPDRDTTVYVYFQYYETQDGVTPLDSHNPDREPVYVVVDEDADEVERILYSAFHYLKGGGPPAEFSMNGSNVQLEVVKPWHHYRPTDAEGSFVELRNYCAVVDEWTGSDWRAAPDAVSHPWTMTERSSWWETDSLRYEAAERYRDARLSLDEFTRVVNGTVGADPIGLPSTAG